ERPFARWHFDTDAGEEIVSGTGQLVFDVVAGAAQGVVAVAARVVTPVAAHQRIALQQAAHDGNTQTARDVVVTGAGRAQPRRAGTFPQRSDWLWRCQPDQLLEQLADFGTGQPVVAVPAMAFDG